MRTHFIKRATSALLALALVLSGTPLVGGTSAMALELESNSRLMYGYTSSTMVGSSEATKNTNHSIDGSSDSSDTNTYSHYYENKGIPKKDGNVHYEPSGTTTAYPEHYEKGSNKKGNIAYGNTNNTAYVFGELQLGSARREKNGSQNLGDSNQDIYVSFNVGAMKQSQNKEATKQDEEAWNVGIVSSTFGTIATKSSADGKEEIDTRLAAQWTTKYAFASRSEAEVKMPDGCNSYVSSDSSTECTTPTVSTYYAPSRKNGETILITGGDKQAGGTTEDTSKQVEFRQSLYPSDDGEYLIEEITVVNLTATDLDFLVANSADVKIGEDDGVAILTSIEKSDTTKETQNLGTTLFDRSGFTSLTIHTQNSSVGAGIEKRSTGEDNSDIVIWTGALKTLKTAQDHWSFNSTAKDYGGKAYTAIMGNQINPDDRSSEDRQGDTAAAVSFYFDLAPYETKTAKIAIQARGTTVYVDPNGREDGTGWLSDPVKTLDKAIEIIKQRSEDSKGGTKKAYIYLLGDVEVSSTVTIPAGYDITIGTTDYELGKSGDTPVYNYATNSTAKSSYVFSTENPPQPIDKTVDEKGNATYKKTIKRAANFNGEMFKIEDTASGDSAQTETTGITFSDVIVDGGNSDTNTSPVVVAKDGYVKTLSGAEFKNNKTSDATTASVFEVSDKANITLSGGTFENNTSVTGSAINFDGAAFSVGGTIELSANKNSSGGSANVYLGKNKYISIGSSLANETRIGVSVADPSSTREVGRNILVETVSNYNDEQRQLYSTANFSADISSNWIQAGPDTENSKDSNQKDTKYNVQLFADTKTVTIEYVRTTETGEEEQLTSQYTGTRPVGTSLTGIEPRKNPLNTTDSDLTSKFESGYVLDYVTVTIAGTTDSTKENGTKKNISLSGISVDKDTGNVSGSLPGSDVSIKYYFTKNEVTYKFYENGGSDVADFTRTVDASSTTSESMPTISKVGYKFLGWFEYTGDDTAFTNGTFYDDANSGDGRYTRGEKTSDTLIEGVTVASTSTATLPAPTSPATHYYVAMWEGEGESRINVKLRNSSGSLTFKSFAKPFAIESEGKVEYKDVPGYKYRRANNSPRTYGSFDATTHNYTVSHMPASSIAVEYIYGVDTSKKFTFTVVHQTESGSPIATSSVARSAEASISAQAMGDFGYTLKSVEVISESVTKDAEDLSESGTGVLSAETYGYTIDGGLAYEGGAGDFLGKMPNQNITVKYTYTSDSELAVVARFYDTEGGLITVRSQPQDLGSTVKFDKVDVYGYKYKSAVSSDGKGTFDSTGVYTRDAMPSDTITLTYTMEKDESKWKTITFNIANSPYNHGTLIDSKGASVTTTTAQFLSGAANADDSTDPNDPYTGPHTFAKMEQLGIVPTAKGSPEKYYELEGWYTDATCTTKVTDTQTWSDNVTLYAKFVEIDGMWIDVTFEKADSNITSLEITGDGKTSDTTAHLYADTTWSEVISADSDGKKTISTVTLQPNTEVKATAIVNYLFDRWTDADGNTMTAGTVLQSGTYIAHAEPDPDVFGGEFVPVGKLDAGPSGDGDGQILVQATKSGKVYVVTTKDGTILASQTAGANNLTFDNLYPGTRYDVYELATGTAVTATRISEIGAGLAYKEVRIPVVESNYYFDYTDDDSDTVTMVIKPADADSQYAILDDGGNVVVGWTSVSGGQVTLKGLEPSTEYTVVARDKTDTSVTEESKFGDGDQVISNPGDDFEAPKYVVETRGGGEIVSVAGTSPETATRHESAHKDDEVAISAPATDASGNAFAYWQVMIDQADTVSGRVYTPDYTFTMKNSNVVLKAVYDTPDGKLASPSIADISEEVRGASDTSFAVEPDSIADLQTSLTRNPEDTTLMSVNKASVKYNIVFNRRDAETAEKELVKPESTSGQDHPTAYTAAWALDVEAERYVNGRKVDGKATASEAIGLGAEFEAYVQLDGTDVDQLDYQLFDMGETGENPAPTPVEVTPVEGDAEANAGLFKFTATVGHTYVMVYSKTFKLRFIDRMPMKNHMHLNDETYNFIEIAKVRKGEALTDTWYTTDYATITAYADGSTPGDVETGPQLSDSDYGFIDIYGYQYDWSDWSRTDGKSSSFALDTKVTRTRNIYGYYTNNQAKRDKAYTDLESLVRTAVALTSNAFLNSSDVARLNAQIAEARVELNKVYPTDPRAATYEELQKAIDDLQALIDELNKKIRDARSKYISSTGGASGGGSSSIGRGKGTKTSPYESSNVDAFELGVDGDWSQTSTGQWQFVLYGGLPLTNRWGKIQIEEEGTGRLITKWYYFNSQATMSTGWIYDKDSKWYYLSPSTANEGEMVTGWILYTPVGTTTPKWYYLNPSGDMATGWHHDAGNQVWYYLDPASGEMATGWRLIDGVWYYFNEVDDYANTKKQYGAMYASETTPDGYTVDADGRLR